MEQTKNWIKHRDNLCIPIERDLLGFTVQDKERLISAIISNALIHEKPEFEGLKSIPVDPSLETIGDYVLDFVIMDNFAFSSHFTAKEVDDFRQLYGKNEFLHTFSKNCLYLQDYILWGPDEIDPPRWDKPTTTILADRFEMLIAVIYLEKGVGAVKEFLKKHRLFEEIDKMKVV